ncbi:uncharacterized protein BXZ73DRAFT_79130 [Epithele typhae]|uniref:uncharacterized protein n=1 Tax=Epithele typhae TaxID=378194 RepID=UPI002008E0D6|nr:uncharacterized protein BXZ73DRAFT_79130 [Epithele typhae]KAH9925005.1 hypothetical protein BXZ73DRAFT_79130 [Epithele typhae]
MATVGTLPFPTFAGSIPAADRASLSGLSDADIRKWIVAKAEEYRKIALSLLSLHNSIAPIHRAFPTELLSEVLSYCWDDMRSVRLMHVCRLWRAAALKTPRLWAEAAAAPGVQFTFNKARIEAQCQDLEEGRISFAATAIELSSPEPLRLKIHFLPDALSQTLSSHTSRLVDLYVRLQSAAQFKSLCALLASGLPNLTVLGIAFFGHVGMYRDWLTPGTKRHSGDIHERDDKGTLSKELTKWSVGVQGLIACTPRLQTLRCVPIDLVSHFACSTVRDMCITPAVFGTNHLEGFIHALKNTPNVMRLDLCMENARLRPDDDAPGWAASPVDLPALQTLVVNLNGNTHAAQYLDLISLSSSVGIDLMQGELGLSFLYQDLPSRHTPLIQSRVQSANTVHICDSYDRWKIPTVVISTSKDDEEPVRFTLSADSHSTAPYLPSLELIETFRDTGAAVTHLVLHQTWAIQTLDGQPDVFRAFPHLTSLDLAGPRAHRVIKALQHLDDDDDFGRPDALVCPRLRTLKVAFGLNRGDDKSASRRAWAALRVRPAGWRETVLHAIPARVAALVKPLEHRARCGLRLKRLEWEDREWDPTLRLEFPPSAVVGTYVPSPALFDQEALEKLVNGPVVFGGFTYQEMPERVVLPGQMDVL